MSNEVIVEDATTTNEQNYSLTIKNDPQIYMDADTFQPLYKADLTLKVKIDAQHDGRLWDEKQIRMHERELIERIMNKLRVAVTLLVTKTNPYSTHGY